MIIKRGTELRVNLGNFEHCILRSDVEVDTEELSVKGMDAEGVYAWAQEMLDKSLAEDLTEALESSGLDKSNSFAFHWKLG